MPLRWQPLCLWSKLRVSWGTTISNQALPVDSLKLSSLCVLSGYVWTVDRLTDRPPQLHLRLFSAETQNDASNEPLKFGAIENIKGCFHPSHQVVVKHQRSVDANPPIGADETLNPKPSRWCQGSISKLRKWAAASSISFSDSTSYSGWVPFAAPLSNAPCLSRISELCRRAVGQNRFLFSRTCSLCHLSARLRFCWIAAAMIMFLQGKVRSDLSTSLVVLCSSVELPRRKTNTSCNTSPWASRVKHHLTQCC